MIFTKWELLYVRTSTFCKKLILIAFLQNSLQEGYKREIKNDSKWK